MHIWWRESYLMCRPGVFNLFQVRDLFVDTLYIIYLYFIYADIKNSGQYQEADYFFFFSTSKYIFF